MAIMLILITVICITHSQWIAPTAPILPSSDYSMSIGYYNNIVSILGGYWDGYDVIEYNVSNNSFIQFDNILPRDSWGWAQYWTQMDNVIFMIDPNSGWMNTYSLSSKLFTQNWMNITIPINVDKFGCIASWHGLLYILGGQHDNENLDALQIYNSSRNEWIIGPVMNEKRASLSCIISPISDMLYAIGGQLQNSDFFSNSIEFISITDIEQNIWQYTNNNLSTGLRNTRSVLYNKYVYIIGGYYQYYQGQNLIAVHVDMVHILDITTNKISISDTLAYPIAYTAPIVVQQELYVFGGRNIDANPVNTFQYIDLTTNEPTTSNPTTAEPTTAVPTTAVPTSAEPTTAEPTTAVPTTAEPTAAVPTTAVPTSADPITNNPTTSVPTTTEVTTFEPTSDEPTTRYPTSLLPTTSNPTTIAPTTAKPTNLSCLYLKLTSYDSRIDLDYLGLYVMHSLSYNGKFVWMKVENKYLIFYDDSNQWRIQSDDNIDMNDLIIDAVGNDAISVPPSVGAWEYDDNQHDLFVINTECLYSEPLTSEPTFHAKADGTIRADYIVALLTSIILTIY